MTLHKPDMSALPGITLVNNEGRARGPPAPIITALAPGSLAANSGRITINHLLIAVNGQRVHTHNEATALLRNAVGDVELTLTAPFRNDSLHIPDTYQQPDAEVLLLITPAAARKTNQVRRISHQRRARRGRAGERRPVAKRSTGL